MFYSIGFTPSNYAKLEEYFGGFIDRSLVRFQFEKGLLQTIVYGGTGTGKTNFVRQFINPYGQPTSTEGLSR